MDLLYRKESVMAKRYFTVILLVSLFFFIGCQSPIDSGNSRMQPPRSTITSTSVSSVADKGEIDLVESVRANREAYRQNLNELVRYYNRTGNNKKLLWASKELNALNSMPWFGYIIEGTNITPDVRATTSIPDADLLYGDGELLMNEAKLGGVVVTNKDKYRAALNKFELLIAKYPTSDKVKDAAYQCGEISEYFNDYSIALDYYKKTYQLDPDSSTYPARFRAARMLDRLHKYDEALKVYKEAIEIEGRYSRNLEWKKNAEERVAELEKATK
jgi:tetratricopeptide (TPR) repeat protein